MGAAAAQAGNLNEAVLAYQKAISIKPDYAKAYNNLGAALKDQGKLHEALEAYNKALSIKPDYAEVCFNMGNALKDEGMLDEAIEAYKKALYMKPDYAEANNNMGNTLKDQGKLDGAIEAYGKAVSIKPYFAEAHRNLSSITKYTPKHAHFITVKNLYKNEDLDSDARCNLNFALAKMYDDIDNFKKAFYHLSEGNALRKKMLNYSIKQDQKIISELIKAQPKIFATPVKMEENSTSIKPIFIIGMLRSGTTLVEQIISSHSKVTGAGELHYVKQYGSGLASGKKIIDSIVLSNFRKQYLLKLSKLSNGTHFVTDKMPQNFYFIPLICAAFPEAKIIHVQRNASATCWSNYKHYFASSSLGYCYDLKDIVEYYNLYTDMMKFWQSDYGDRIYHFNYENLVTDQEKETKDLIKHLNLDWEDACLSPQKNSRSVKTASQQQVREKVYKGSSEVWRKYEPFLNGAFDSLHSS